MMAELIAGCSSTKAMDNSMSERPASDATFDSSSTVSSFFWLPGRLRS